MSGSAIVRRAVYVFAAVLFCILFVPRPAAADDVVNIDFSGTACAGTTQSCTSPVTITGSYSIDESTGGTIDGNWTFLNTPLGTLSGSGGEASQSIAPQGFPTGIDALDFMVGPSNDPTAVIQLAFSSSQIFDGTLVVGPVGTSYGLPPSFGGDIPSGPIFEFVSGTASVVAAPEPSSIALLGLGLFGLFILRRKRTFARLRAAQS